ncbi:LOW QUALITY PROTEIN: hypothetical protein PHMEG_00011324 [Phytophthora megakarya]|uniref:RNase H type-1 domain-containing protein n=1 Tax=Phytophthora megakarya TaxID=4795 RepID=A0A225WC08_9STRA|nr:LOW QUALITY PROTEIN: hypothetical protein PHMEG_00011324 [Phytophthora megakarya]
MLEDIFEGAVLRFDGAAKTSTRQGSCGCILWELSGWKILDAQGFIIEDITVNDTEYCEHLNGLTMAQARGVRDLVAMGDSPIVIQQVQGLINCNQPKLQRQLTSCETLKKGLIRSAHVKRYFNQAANYLSSKALLLGRSWSVQEGGECKPVQRISKIKRS